MDATASAYAFGKFFGRLHTVVEIMKRRIDSEMLQKRVNEICDKLEQLDCATEHVCRQDACVVNKKTLFEENYEKVKVLDQAFGQLLEIVETTTGIRSLFFD